MMSGVGNSSLIHQNDVGIGYVGYWKLQMATLLLPQGAFRRNHISL